MKLGQLSILPGGIQPTFDLSALRGDLNFGGMGQGALFNGDGTAVQQMSKQTNPGYHEQPGSLTRPMHQHPANHGLSGLMQRFPELMQRRNPFTG